MDSVDTVNGRRIALVRSSTFTSGPGIYSVAQQALHNFGSNTRETERAERGRGSEVETDAVLRVKCKVPRGTRKRGMHDHGGLPDAPQKRKKGRRKKGRRKEGKKESLGLRVLSVCSSRPAAALRSRK